MTTYGREITDQSVCQKRFVNECRASFGLNDFGVFFSGSNTGMLQSEKTIIPKIAYDQNTKVVVTTYEVVKTEDM